MPTARNPLCIATWVGSFDDHRIGERRGIARCSRRRWPIIHDEGDPAPSGADALQVDVVTISEHHLKRPIACSGERTSSGCPVLSTLAIAVMVFQLRVVTGTPKSRSNVPR